jgi:hypothetical protein
MSIGGIWMASQVCSSTLLGNRSIEQARRCFPPSIGESSVAFGYRLMAGLFVRRLPTSIPAHFSCRSVYLKALNDDTGILCLEEMKSNHKLTY